MQKLARDAWRFALVLFVFVAVLAVLDVLPQFLGGEPRGIVRYQGVGTVEARYAVKLWRPVEMGSGARRPTSDVRSGPRQAGRGDMVVRVAVGDPDWAEFAWGDRFAGTLIVCQTLQEAGTGARPPEAFLPAGEVLQTTDGRVAGRAARIRRLLLPDGTIAHELWWREGGRHVILRLPGPLDELMRAANSAFGNPS